MNRTKYFSPWGLEFEKDVLLFKKTYLWKLFLNMRNVIRFADSEKYDSVFVEDDMLHIIRLIKRVGQLDNGYKLNKNRMKRLIFIHDLPEMGKKVDVSAVDKALNIKLDVVTRNEEVELAKRIFRKNDLKIYEEFERAGDFWKGRVEKLDVSKEALVCQLLDKIDGNMTFHYRLKLGYSVQKIKGPHHLDAFRHMFSQYEKFSQRYGDIRDKKFVKYCDKLLRSQFEYLVWLWSDVGEKLIPEILLENLQKLYGKNWRGYEKK